MKAKEKLLKSKDVAWILDCTSDDVVVFAQKGKLEAFKHGRFWRFYALVLALFVCPLSASAWTGKVVGMSDGDTITVLNEKTPIKVRLYGIDCPEKKQTFGTRVKRFDRAFVSEIATSKDLSKKVVLKPASDVARNLKVVYEGYVWDENL
jgi:endonuclease YncB( thermonuclease family)